MKELLEQCAILLGSATTLLGGLLTSRHTTVAPAYYYYKVSGRGRSYPHESDNPVRKFWSVAPEVVITSSFFR
jgi:hypothetical protein